MSRSTRTHSADFGKCSESQSDIRSKYGLGGVKKETKMTDAEVEGLATYLGELGLLKDKATYLSGKTMSQAAKLLCRWPRPSEIARLAINHAPHLGRLQCHSASVKFRFLEEGPNKGKRFAKLIGAQGTKLIGLTERNNLLYSWASWGADDYTLHLYGKTMADVEAATADFLEANGDVIEAVGAPKKRLRFINVNSANWTPVKAGK